MAVNRDLAALLELLACPNCGGDLEAAGKGLCCTRSGHEFGRRDGIPSLVSEYGHYGEPSSLARLQYRILGNPRLYDLHQRHGGGQRIAAQVASALGDVAASTLLDVGAGTGMVAALLPPGTRYIWLDNDELKLQGFLAKSIECMAVLGDAARLPFRDRSADVAVMVEVSHHLPDEALAACLREVARVTNERFVFVDALAGTRLRSRLLWQLDLGRFPRSEAQVTDALERSFDVQRVERFRINHDHVVCVCVPLG